MKKYLIGGMDYSKCKTNVVNDCDAPEYIEMLVEEVLNGHPTFGPDRFSVTELEKSEKQIVQKRRLLYEGQLSMTISESQALWFGSLLHDYIGKFMDRCNGKYLKEVRMEMERDGVTISGAFDSYNIIDNELLDHKFPKITTFDMNKKRSSDDWFKQLCAYTELIEKTYGKRPEKLKIFAGLKDFTPMKVGLTAGYPDKSIQWIIWKTPSKEVTSAVVDEMFAKAKRCMTELTEGLESVECKPSDCWCTEDFCVMKKDGKRAYKTFKVDEIGAVEAEKQARELQATLSDDYRVLHRVKEASNCQKYCACRAFCEQGKRMAVMEEVKEDITDGIPY